MTIKMTAKQNKRSARCLSVGALLVSVFFHSGIMACGLLLFYGSPPSPMPVGEVIEVSLLSLSKNKSKNLAETQAEQAKLESESQSNKENKTKNEAKTFDQKLEQEKMQTAKITKNKEQKQNQGQKQTQSQVQSQNNANAQGQTQRQSNTQDSTDAQGQSNIQSNANAGQDNSKSGTLPMPLGGQVNPVPKYPELARQRSQEGQVVLLIQVDIHGNPVQVQIENSSGYKLLDQAALQTIQLWKFSPALHNGRAVPGAVKVPVTFRLTTT